MGFYQLMSKVLRTNIANLEIIIYFIAIIIIIVTVVQSTYSYFRYILQEEKHLRNIRGTLLNNIAFALSFILSMEILKIFYIKTYKQLIIVASLVILKLVIELFINKELDDQQKERPLNLQKFN